MGVDFHERGGREDLEGLGREMIVRIYCMKKLSKEQK